MAWGPRPRRPRGVSLLEMLVALTILAATGTVLFDWVYQVSTRLQRLNRQQELAMAQLQALQALRAVNPAAAPGGSRKFVGFDMTWSAVPHTPMRNALDANDAVLPRQVGLFDVKVTLLRPDRGAERWVEFDTRLLGWREPERAADQPAFAGPSGGASP